MGNEYDSRICEFGQDHLLRFRDEMNEFGKQRLDDQLVEIDWEEMNRLIGEYVLRKPEQEIPPDLEPAPFFPIEPEDSVQCELYRRAGERGQELIRSGSVAALTVAGGQGTRLGFDGPKGTFPITPVKSKTLFQYFAESLLRAMEKYGGIIPWCIMTSPVNDSPTREFFAENDFFAYPADQVHFFSQGTMPAIAMDGRLLLGQRDSLALSPDGHGGTLLALKRSGLLTKLKEQGILYFSYFQVDNPLVSVADPLFIGLHDLEASEMSCRMLPKTGPYEKLGNFCIADGRLQIIEYSDMPDELAERRNPDGKLSFLAGSPAIHVISLDFIDRLTAGGRLQLPWHRAEKKVPFIDSDGGLISPEQPNAIKLETFIFDALPLAERTMVLEARREDEFSPVKNPGGVDSAETCRAMLVERDARWLRSAGVEVPQKADGAADCLVELSPRRYLGEDDVLAANAENRLPCPERGGKEYYA